MLPSHAAKTAILSAFQQTLISRDGESPHTLPLTAATAMGMLIALQVSGMVEPEEFQALSEQVISRIHTPDDAGVHAD